MLTNTDSLRLRHVEVVVDTADRLDYVDGLGCSSSTISDETSFEKIRTLIGSLKESVNSGDAINELDDEFQHLETKMRISLDSLISAAEASYERLYEYETVGLLSKEVKYKAQVPPEIARSFKKAYQDDLCNAVLLMDSLNDLLESGKLLKSVDGVRVTSVISKLRSLKIDKDNIFESIAKGELKTPVDWLKDNASSYSKSAVTVAFLWKLYDTLAAATPGYIDKAFECHQSKFNTTDLNCGAETARAITSTLLLILPLLVATVLLIDHIRQNGFR